MKFLFVRHGKTHFNEINLTSSQEFIGSAIHLNEKTITGS